METVEITEDSEVLICPRDYFIALPDLGEHHCRVCGFLRLVPVDVVDLGHWLATDQARAAAEMSEAFRDGGDMEEAADVAGVSLEDHKPGPTFNVNDETIVSGIARFVDGVTVLEAFTIPAPLEGPHLPRTTARPDGWTVRLVADDDAEDGWRVAK